MHEFAIAQQLVKLIENQAKLANITKVIGLNLTLGEQSHIQTETLELYFSLLTEAKTNVAHGAQLHVKRTPMIFYCDSCKLDYPVRKQKFQCPYCDSLGHLIALGDELSLESMEVPV